MTPNATVSYMARQVEQRLVEAKAARAWMADEAARRPLRGSGLVRLSARLVAMLGVRVAERRRTAETAGTASRSPIGAVDAAR